MKFLYTALALAIVTSGISPSVAMAASKSVDPHVFALPSDQFPPGAQTVKSDVASNIYTANTPGVLHFGKPFSREGRLTGYYAEALITNAEPSGKQHPITVAYLVSIFGTNKQAAAAYRQQQDAFENLIALSPPQALKHSSTPAVGDAGHQAAYAYHHPRDGRDYDIGELFFKRGRVLVEIWFSFFIDDIAPYVQNVISTQDSMAMTLDHISMTMPPASVHCTKGMKLIKGKCKCPSGSKLKGSKCAKMGHSSLLLNH